MSRRRINIVLPVVIVAIALPATLSYLYYRVTGDPTLRPLGVTLSSLRENEVPGYTAALTVLVEWGRDRPPGGQQQLLARLGKTLSVYPVDFRIKLIETTGASVQIYYLVGASRLGPYRLADVSAGVRPALAAYGLSVPD